MRGEARGHGKTRQGHADHVGFADKDADVVKVGAVLGQSAGVQFSNPRSGFGDCRFLLRDNKQRVAGRQGDVARGDDVLPAFADHRYLDAARQPLLDFFERLPRDFFADGNLAHVKALSLRREFRLNHLRHEIDAQNWTDDPERVCDRIAYRRLLIFHDIERRLKLCRACHRSGVDAERVTNFDTENLAETEGDQKACDARHKRQQIVGSADALHSLKKLSSIKDADPVKEHDEARQTDWPDDLGLRREGAEREPDEEHGSHAERKASDTDLADQVAKTDRKEGCEDWLGPDDLAGQSDHDKISRNKLRIPGLAGTATCRAKLLDNSVHQLGRRWWRIGVLVFEFHCLPLELAHLVKWLHLDPFDILQDRKSVV